MFDTMSARRVRGFLRVGREYLRGLKQAGVLVPVHHDVYLSREVFGLLPYRPFDLATLELLTPNEAAKLSGVSIRTLASWEASGLQIAVRLPPLPGGRRSTRRYVRGALMAAVVFPQYRASICIDTFADELPEVAMLCKGWIADGSLPTHPNSVNPTAVMMTSFDVRRRMLQYYFDELER